MTEAHPDSDAVPDTSSLPTLQAPGGPPLLICVFIHGCAVNSASRQTSRADLLMFSTCCVQRYTGSRALIQHLAGFPNGCSTSWERALNKPVSNVSCFLHTRCASLRLFKHNESLTCCDCIYARSSDQGRTGASVRAVASQIQLC